MHTISYSNKKDHMKEITLRMQGAANGKKPTAAEAQIAALTSYTSLQQKEIQKLDRKIIRLKKALNKI